MNYHMNGEIPLPFMTFNVSNIIAKKYNEVVHLCLVEVWIR